MTISSTRCDDLRISSQARRIRLRSDHAGTLQRTSPRAQAIGHGWHADMDPMWAVASNLQATLVHTQALLDKAIAAEAAQQRLEPIAAKLVGQRRVKSDFQWSTAARKQELERCRPKKGAANVSIPPDAEPAQVRRLKQLLEEYRDVFANGSWRLRGDRVRPYP